MTRLGLMMATAVSLVATPSHAFVFLLLGAGAAGSGGPAEPPTLQERPAINADAAVTPEGLPAPFLMDGAQEARAMPRLEDFLAEAGTGSTGPRVFAQASNDEILRRLEALEQENRRLREQLGGGAPAASGAPAPRGGLPSTQLPAQVTHGWWVHLHDWNAAGDLGNGPVVTYRYDQQVFAASTTLPADTRSWRQVALFRFEGWLRVREAGTYQFGAQLNCGFGHPCNLFIQIDGVRVLQHANQRITNSIIHAERRLEPGDYRIEYIWGMSTTSFSNYEPYKQTMRPLFRTPSDMNFRDYGPDELLVPDRRDVPIGPAFLIRN